MAVPERMIAAEPLSPVAKTILPALSRSRQRNSALRHSQASHKGSL